MVFADTVVETENAKTIQGHRDLGAVRLRFYATTGLRGAIGSLPLADRVKQDIWGELLRDAGDHAPQSSGVTEGIEEGKGVHTGRGDSAEFPGFAGDTVPALQ